MRRELSQPGHASVNDHSILIDESFFLHVVYFLLGEAFLMLVFITYHFQAGLEAFIELVCEGIGEIL